MQNSQLQWWIRNDFFLFVFIRDEASFQYINIQKPANTFIPA